MVALLWGKTESMREKGSIMVNIFDKHALRTALIQSRITDTYMTVDESHSARLQYDGEWVTAMVIDHDTLQLKARADRRGSLTHELLSSVVDEILEKTAKYDVDDYNIMGIHTYGDLLRKLQGGLKFGYVSTMRDGTKDINTVLSADEHYIRWHHYGSSANQATAKDMKWVIETIFKTDLANFIREYIHYYGY